MTPLIAAVTFGRFAWRPGQGVALELVRTETFTVLAMCPWFSVLNCQSAGASALGLRIVRNRWLLCGLSLSVLLPLLGLASMVPWAEEARKRWVRTMRRARP